MLDLEIDKLEKAVVESIRIKTDQAALNIVEEKIKKMQETDPVLANLYKFASEKTYVVDTKKYSSEAMEHTETGRITSITESKIPVWLYGPSGTGKTTIAKTIADKLKLTFYPMQKITDEFQLTGYRDANGNYHETPLYEAMLNGGLFFIDEIDASVPEALILINTLLANGFLSFPNGTLEAHENFRVLVAGNTIGKGGNESYIRNKIDSATLDRFIPIFIDYDEKIELAITNFDDELLHFVREIREIIQKNMIDHVISYRALQHFKLLEKFENEFIFENILFKTLALEDIKSIYNNLPEMSKNRVYKNFKKYINSK